MLWCGSRFRLIGRAVQARGYKKISYFEAPEDTRQTTTADRWLRTGDLGTLDDSGYLRVPGRLKDMVIRGGDHPNLRRRDE